jgi:hypothetical protein
LNLLLKGIGKQTPDRFHIGAVHYGRLAQLSFSLGALFSKYVTQVLLASFNLAASGNRKTLGRASVGLDLGHYISS